MLNPASASQTPLSSRIALLTGLLLAGAFGLVATIALPVSNFKKTGNRTASINTTGEPARFGLLARRRLLENSASPTPVRIIGAKTREMNAN